jgi:tetraacyldisaccharide 4'-kinase
MLRLLSLPYAVVVVVRNLLYDWHWKKSYRSPLPVISIGNLSVGGTGKSPTVAWIARWFRQRGIRTAILSRGYGQLDSGQNDEALEMELQLPDVPHLQHWDRVASARLADEELQMQLLLLDDGFQHRRLARDLDIVLIDATDPPTAHWLLPGGILREPWTSLARADLIILTRANQAGEEKCDRMTRRIRRIAASIPVVRAQHRPTHVLTHPNEQVSVERLTGMQLLAFCAVGNPDSFFQGLEDLGAEILGTRVWPDHHPYSAGDISSLASWVDSFPHAQMLICTMKDWVKIQTSHIGRLPLAALVIELHIVAGESEFANALEKIVISQSNLRD